MSEWFAWVFIAGFLAVYAGAYVLGGWLADRANRKHGPAGV